MFEGRVESVKHVNIIYDDVERHYHVITNLTVAMAKKYVCKACNKICRSDVSHVSDQTCSDCATISPCVFRGNRIPCENAIDTFEVGHVSIITRDVVRLRKEAFASVSVIAARVEYS